MIELSGVSKTYAKSDRKAIDSLSLSIPNGRIFGFLGPNGAGKTTTIRVFDRRHIDGPTSPGRQAAYRTRP